MLHYTILKLELKQMRTYILHPTLRKNPFLSSSLNEAALYRAKINKFVLADRTGNSLCLTSQYARPLIMVWNTLATTHSNVDIDQFEILSTPHFQTGRF